MSDRYPAEIWIGGKFPRSGLTDLRDKINSAHVSSGWGDDYIELPEGEGEAEKALLALCEDCPMGTLHLRDSQASYGTFEELESYLRINRIAYNRRSDGYYEYAAELEMFRPDMGVRDFSCLNDGSVMVPAARVKEAIDLVKRGAHGAALTSLHEELGTAIPELEKFEIVDDKDLYPVVGAKALQPEKLVEVVTAIQRLLFEDFAGPVDSLGDVEREAGIKPNSHYWNPNKVRDRSDLDGVIGILEQHGLVPKEIRRQ